MSNPAFIVTLKQQFIKDHPYLIEQSRELAQAYTDKSSVVQEKTLQKIGTSLWQALDCEAKFLKSASRQDILNIIIRSDDPKILNLAWETLYHPEFGFLGRSVGFTLSRRLPTQATLKLPEVECTPLRILLFAAMPMDLGEHARLQIEEEKANILQAITPLEEKGLVTLLAPDDGRFESFKHSVQDYHPHLVYLSGHGTLHHNTLKNTYHGTFLFEDQYANSLEISEDDLVSCFNNIQVQAIVLSACESGKFDARQLNNGLSLRLAQQGIPHVIGMRESILDNAGLEFAVTFLQEIANKESVATALQTARRAIKSHLIGYIARGQQDTPILRAITKQQWCLPSLISHNISQPLVDWSFTPQPKESSTTLNDSINTVSLPAQFLGRKRELYELFQPLLNGSQKQLLLTAAGGMGKTALAGQLCQQLNESGFEIFAYSAREENQWPNFVTSLEYALNENYTTRYDNERVLITRQQKAQTLLKLLLEQHHGKVVLFLDNLESIQDPKSRKLTDDEIQFWLETAQDLTAKGLRIILTSRWCLPKWDSDKHHYLEKPAYSDFIAFARQKGLLTALSSLKKTREMYDTLGGNFRAFEFFVNASKNMDLAQTDDFLAALNQAKDESQTDMALEKILSQRSPLETSLLTGLLAYPTPVPIKGVIVAQKIRPLFPENDEYLDAIKTLTNMSLVERIYNNQFSETDYQIAPLLRDYLQQQGQNITIEALKITSLYLYENLLKQRPHIDLALSTYNALIAADEIETAQDLLINTITGTLSHAGLYHSLLSDYLIPSLNHTHADKVLAKTHSQIGKQYLAIGSYDKANTYFDKSLVILKKLGDKLNEGGVLNDISQSYDAQSDYEIALKYLSESLTIARNGENKLGEGIILNNIAVINYKRGEYEAALKYHNQSLSIQQEIGDKSGEGATLNNISQILIAQGKYEKALKYLYESLAIHKKIGDKSNEGGTLNNISRIFKAWGDHDSALKYLNQSLVIQQKIGNKAGESTTLNNISQIFKARKDYDTALKLLKQSMKIQQEIGDKSGEGATLNNMATITHIKGDSESALELLNNSLMIHQETGNQLGEGHILNNISQIFRAQGDNQTALKYLEQCLAIRQKIGHKSGESVTLNNISHIYWSGGDYDATLKYLHQSLAIRQEIGDKSGEDITLSKISQVLKEKEDHEAALK